MNMPIARPDSAIRGRWCKTAGLRQAGVSFALCAAACQQPSVNEGSVPQDQWGRSDTIRYFVPGYPDPFTPQGATLAIEDLTGIQFVETEDRIGAVSMIPIRDEPLDSGAEHGEVSRGICSPWVSFSPTDTLHFGHMLGHAAGLEHHRGSCNFMAEAFGVQEYDQCDSDLTIEDDQIDALRAFAWALENTCDEWE